MIQIIFENIKDNNNQILEAQSGDNLLTISQANGLPLEGTCEGNMACSTCHVIIAADYFRLLPKASEEEEDILDLAADTTRTSRLACQITIVDALDGMVISLPKSVYNMQGR